MNWNDDDVRKYCAQRGLPLPAGISSGGSAPKQAKYRNKRTELDGKRYDSKREAQRASEIKLLAAAGEIAGYAEQVSFRLPGGIVYRADFVLLNWDGTFIVEDAKGVRTKEYIIKRKLMAENGLEIQEV